MKKKNLIKGIFLAIFILICSFMLYIINAFIKEQDLYKFGIKRSENRTYFEGKEYHAINPEEPGWENTYNFLTGILIDELNNQKIEIEHLVMVDEVDKKLIKKIDSNDYLFMSIKIPFKNSVRIKVKNVVDGFELEEVGTYIYTRPDTKNYYWKVEEINPKDFISPNFIEDYGYVKIYKFPPNKHYKINKEDIFKEGIQNIEMEIKKENEITNKKFKFKIYWYIESSLWKRFISIT